MLRKLIVFIVLLISLYCHGTQAEPQTQQSSSSSDTQGRFFDLATLLGLNRYPRPYYPGSGYYPPNGAYPGSYYPGGAGSYPGYGTNFIGGGYGGFNGNGGLNSYYGYRNNQYNGGGNLGFGYYDLNLFENRNVRPQYNPSGYRGYN
ncbi:hypothetical protein PVAND_002944 [Polypedilum vanderplanki]|uniref:Prisilkin-39-like n=1 Tax=Polypedilum vanderplanki TaxID=319348 RepID=A0A9J6BSN2_POLVA|nr:hypothetical protein PVAND_002944 [Polypedilum vanderplanki]